MDRSVNFENDGNGNLRQVFGSICKGIASPIGKIDKGMAHATLADELQGGSVQPSRHINLLGCDVNLC